MQKQVRMLHHKLQKLLVMRCKTTKLVLSAVQQCDLPHIQLICLFALVQLLLQERRCQFQDSHGRRKAEQNKV